MFAIRTATATYITGFLVPIAHIKPITSVSVEECNFCNNPEIAANIDVTAPTQVISPCGH
jgi:hypothetical protein